MTEPSDALPPLPAFVRRRDGRLVPFDADRICRTLFDAAARLGRADPFLARELTDGVLHFLSVDSDVSVPTTEQVRELTAKVVRELGQPALAAAVAEDHPSATVPPTDAVFGPDLIAAHHDRLLTLGGLDTPFELASCVLKPTDTLVALRQVCGGTAVLDGPEHTLAHDGTSAADFVRDLVAGLRATRLNAVVNLNAAAPPPWADDLADGPLFASRGPEPQRLARLADELLELLPADAPVRTDWHLSACDFEPSAEPRLRRVLDRACAGAPLAFVFDRPNRPVALAEGVDRQHPAVLLAVGLGLPRLAEQVLPATLRLRLDGAAVQRFLTKLASLARMALSAALQKRDFLRRHAHDRPGLTRGFLLDRARLVASPVGLEALTQTLLDRGLSGGGGLDLARRVAVRLRDVLRAEGRAARLETCLDGADEQLSPGGEPDPAALLRRCWEGTEVGRLRFLTADAHGAAPTIAPVQAPAPRSAPEE